MRRAIRILVPALVQAALGAQTAPSQAFALPNGLKVVLFEDHSLPLLRGELRLALPPPAQDPDAWLRPLGFHMLEAGGSGARSVGAFAQAADAIGLDLSVAPGASEARWAFTARSQDQETALALLADRVTRPAFDPLSLESARSQAWSELSGAEALAAVKLRFARSLAALPEPEEQALGSVTSSALAAWHRARFTPARATLVLWGDLDLAQARQLALLSLGAWTGGPASASKPSAAAESGPFLAALPGEAPSVSLGLVEDGTEAAGRSYLRGWVEAQLRAAGLTVEPSEARALVASASAPLGTPAESLRARLAAALDALPAAFTERDFSLIAAQTADRARLLGLHPAALVTEAAGGPEAPADAAAAKALLGRWCAASNRRMLASGDPGALQGLQSAQASTATPKR